MNRLLIACVLLVPVLAIADKGAAPPVPDIASLLAPDADRSAAFAFAGNGVFQGAAPQASDLPKGHVARNVSGAYSKNKLAYWASADLAASATAKDVDGHASALWEKSDAGWKLVAFSIVPAATGKQQQAANKKGLVPPKIQNANGASGEYFLTVFAGVFGHDAPDVVADHKDDVMFGSGPGERYVGGAAIKKMLLGWDLQFEMRDGLASGLTKGRLLWIAANMNARPANNDKAAPTPYRVFLIFEANGGDGDYQLVHASFAAMTEQAWP